MLTRLLIRCRRELNSRSPLKGKWFRYRRQIVSIFAFPRLVHGIQFILLISLAPTTFANTLPDLGEQSQAAVPGKLTQRIEISVLQALSQERIFTDPWTQVYFEGMVERLFQCTKTSCPQFNLFIVNSPEVNAFAAPRRIVALNTGLILAMNTPDEIAAVLAHELAHLEQHHIERRIEEQQRDMLPAAAGMLGAVALGAAAGEQAGAAGIMATIAGTQQAGLNFTRSMETEADQLGLQRLSDAQYDPQAFLSLLEKLQKQENLNQAQSYGSYLKTHPLSTQRLANVKHRLRSVQHSANSSDLLEFLLLRERVRALTQPLDQTLHFYQKASTENPAEATAFLYGQTLVRILRQQWPQALSSFQALKPSMNSSPLFDSLSAEIAVYRGQTQYAISLLTQALKQSPENTALLIQTVQLLIHEQRIEEAQQLFKAYPVSLTPDYIELRLKVDTQLGNRTSAYLALAHTALVQKRKELAKDLLRSALSEPNLSEDEKSRIKTRLRAIDRA